MNNFFSIVIPIFNEEKYLPHLLENLAYQVNKNFEVIIVDAFSTDETKNKALKFTDKFRLLFYQSKRRNISAQKNLGAQKASNPYLIFLDADSSVEPIFTDKLYEHIVARENKVFYPYNLPDNNNLIIHSLFFFANFLIEISQYTSKPFSMPGTLIIDKLFFKSIGGFDESLYNAEDHDLIQKVKQHGLRAEILKDVKVIYSLRRVRKDGWAKTIFHILRTSIYLIFKGKIKEKIFEYEMGGHLYKNDPKSQNKK